MLWGCPWGGLVTGPTNQAGQKCLGTFPLIKCICSNRSKLVTRSVSQHVMGLYHERAREAEIQTTPERMRKHL